MPTVNARNLTQNQNLRSLEATPERSEAAAVRKTSQSGETQYERITIGEPAPPRVNYERPRPTAENVEIAAPESQTDAALVGSAQRALEAYYRNEQSGPRAIVQSQEVGSSRQVTGQNSDSRNRPTEAVDFKVRVAELGAGGGTPVADKRDNTRITSQGVDGTTSVPRDDQSQQR